MASTIEEYFDIHRHMMWVRFLHQGSESSEEDSLLDRLDRVWMRLTEEERERVNRVDPGLPDPAPPSHLPRLEDVDVLRYNGEAPRESRKAV